MRARQHGGARKRVRQNSPASDSQFSPSFFASAARERVACTAMKPARLAPLVAAAILAVPSLAAAGTLAVGPGKTYAAPCAAIAAAQAGDTIEVDAAGTYVGDVCAWKTDNLTLKAVNGRAKINAGGKNAQGKGTWVIYAANATIDGFEMFGQVLNTGDTNGAAIRHQGLNLTIRNSYFHDNQNGILGGPLNPDGSDASGKGIVRIERSEFSQNGVLNSGYEHNMYLNHYAEFWLVSSYSHDAKEGHLVKTRAAENHILYNRIWDGDNGTPSYEINVPDGGKTFIIGNVIEQNATTHNPNIISYAEESRSNPDQSLFVINNTIVNRRSGGTFLVDAAPTPAVLKNNVFFGTGTVTAQASALLANNSTTTNPGFVNLDGHDFHLVAGSELIDKGADPGTGGGISLLPTAQYVAVASQEGRSVAGAAIDIGAFELGGGGPVVEADGGVVVGTDGGAVVRDGGVVETDSGVTGDGGTPLTQSGDGDCSCTMHRATGTTRVAGLALLVAGLVASRRRKR